jgi:hypothetical protein
MIHLVRVHAAYVRGVGRKNNKDARCGSTQTFAAYNFYTYDEIIWRSINSEKVTPKKKTKHWLRSHPHVCFRVSHGHTESAREKTSTCSHFLVATRSHGSEKKGSACVLAFLVLASYMITSVWRASGC